MVGCGMMMVGWMVNTNSGSLSLSLSLSLSRSQKRPLTHLSHDDDAVPSTLPPHSVRVSGLGSRFIIRTGFCCQALRSGRFRWAVGCLCGVLSARRGLDLWRQTSSTGRELTCAGSVNGVCCLLWRRQRYSFFGIAAGGASLGAR